MTDHEYLDDVPLWLTVLMLPIIAGVFPVLAVAVAWSEWRHTRKARP